MGRRNRLLAREPDLADYILEELFDHLNIPPGSDCRDKLSGILAEEQS